MAVPWLVVGTGSDPGQTRRRRRIHRSRDRWVLASRPVLPGDGHDRMGVDVGGGRGRRGAASTVLLIDPAISRADGLVVCARLADLLRPVSGRGCPGRLRRRWDRRTEALARLRLTARRLGADIRVRGAQVRLRQLLAFTGLDEIIPIWRVRPSGLPPPMPALLTNTSRRSVAVRTSAARWRTWARLARSATTVLGRGTPCVWWMSCAVWSSLSGSRPCRIRVAPRRRAGWRARGRGRARRHSRRDRADPTDRQVRLRPALGCGGDPDPGPRLALGGAVRRTLTSSPSARDHARV